MILVTGGLGYIGSHTVVALIKKGYKVLIVDDLSNSSLSVLERLKQIIAEQPLFEQIDLNDKKRSNSCLSPILLLEVISILLPLKQ